MIKKLKEILENKTFLIFMSESPVWLLIVLIYIFMGRSLSTVSQKIGTISILDIAHSVSSWLGSVTKYRLNSY